jgi:hypothetical protein
LWNARNRVYQVFATTAHVLSVPGRSETPRNPSLEQCDQRLALSFVCGIVIDLSKLNDEPDKSLQATLAVSNDRCRRHRTPAAAPLMRRRRAIKAKLAYHRARRNAGRIGMARCEGTSTRMSNLVDECLARVRRAYSHQHVDWDAIRGAARPWKVGLRVGDGYLQGRIRRATSNGILSAGVLAP